MTSDRGALSPQGRAEALHRMASREHDVLVVGGGVVGTGAALDATTRGLSTAVLEARDWASGTSSRSSKLIHGGLRYLEMLDFGLVREALGERNLLTRRLAPHLVTPLPFLYPLAHRGWERLYVGAGLTLYDAMAATGGNRLPGHRHLTRRGALRLAPGLRPDSLTGGVRYYDAQVDDARLVVALARTAFAYGAAAASRARVTGLLRSGGRVVGARVRDLETGAELRVRARHVVNATGVWTDETQAMAGDTAGLRVRASKGIHLVVPSSRIDARTGLILRTATSVLFVIPWGRHWVIGTTDTEWRLDKAHPAASRRDIDYLLREVNQVLRRPLTRDDVEGVWAGLRPLLEGESDSTSKLSREHVVTRPVPGLVVVAGGKLTTYRVMARDAVDALAKDRADVPPSCTDVVPLLGAEGLPVAWNQRHEAAAASGLAVPQVERLLRRHGSLVGEVLELVRCDRALGEPVTGAPDYIWAEVVHAVTHEGARHVDDVLTRRTRVSVETFDRGLASVRRTVELMGPLLGWSPAQVAREVEHYQLRVEAERLSQQQPDDETADAARLGAPDLVPVTRY
jgi:glycerol-3-phosphate dehydrogenase